MAAQRTRRRLADSDVFVPKELHGGIGVLLRAWEYARRLECNSQEFAVAAGELRGVGLTTPDLLWLVRNGWAESVKESLRNGHAGRTGRISCVSESRVILTCAGAEIMRNLTDVRTDSLPASLASATACTTRLRDSRAKPTWDRERRELWFERRLVKRYWVRAPNQKRILDAFEEEGWVRRITDPLPREIHGNARIRLRETIKSHNRNQACQVMRFSCDGTGESVLWESWSGRMRAVNE